MDELLNQIENSVASENYLLGLFVALTLPDICGALESWNGRSTDSRYKSWFDKWVAPKYDKMITGEQCYGYHHGLQHKKYLNNNLGYSKIAFLEPNKKADMHRNIVNDTYNVDIELFCADIVASTREWLISVENNENFVKNYEYFVTIKENAITDVQDDINEKPTMR